MQLKSFYKGVVLQVDIAFVILLLITLDILSSLPSELPLVTLMFIPDLFG